MHPRTQATLAELKSVSWFRAVGDRDHDGVVVLRSWEEAIESCASVEWESLCLEASNQFRERLNEAAPERFQQWNQIAVEMREATILLVEEKVATAVEEHNLPQVFVDTVQWDILHVGMEAEFADVYPPGFYASQAFWYVQGHFPCGWEGVFPDGMLVVF